MLDARCGWSNSLRTLAPACLLTAALILLFSGGAACAQRTWKLAWSDEFNGPAGSAVDGTKWVFEVGNGSNGWGNHELEYYTDSTKNAAMDGAGNLVVTAGKETLAPKYRCWSGACSYTSARLKTQAKFEQAYGRFEARLKIPYGQGLWPAFWMLGNNINTAGWPACGEIDIMENKGKEPSINHGTIHGPGYAGAHGPTGIFTLADGKEFSADYHTFAALWEENKITFSVDGQAYETRTPENIPEGKTWVYNHPFYIILNLAIGGQFGGDPDAGTKFPQDLLVDYVRVYKPKS